MELFRFLLRLSWKRVLLAALLGVISGVGNTGLLAVLNGKLNGGGGSPSTLLWIFVGLCVFVPVTRFACEAVVLRLGLNALFTLRMRLCRQVLAAPMRHLEGIGAHRIQATLTEDVSAITHALTYIPIACIHVVVVFCCLSYLGWLSPLALAAVLGSLVVGIISYQLPTLRGMRLMALAREKADQLYGHFRALTLGTKELKLHNRRRAAFLEQMLEPTAGELRHYSFRGMLYFTAAASWGQVLFFIVVGALVFGLPGLQAVNNEILTGCALTVLYMMTPLEVILNTLPSVGQAGVALKKVESLGLSLTARTETAAAETPEPAWRHLELAGVTHTYRRENEDDSFTLGPIDLTFHPGELVFLTGGNGSGKTTLVKLIIGLYGPEGGEIKFDGRSVTDENRESYRQQFSVVFSDFFLFEKLLGLDAHDLDAKALSYLVQLQLDHKVRVTVGELSTTELSQGQRKRLALLTAYLEDRPIYVFDEWAADQDPHFKDIFYLQLLPELKERGKTILVISHDDRYYHLADRLIKLDYGQIVHDEYAPGRLPPATDLPVNNRVNPLDEATRVEVG